jgi:predicted DNA-binding transcriptional regulator AlpA
MPLNSNSRGYVTLPELGALVGLSTQGMYNCVRRGTGPLTRPLGQREVVTFGAAVSWAEDRKRWAKLTSAKRRALEDGIRELRVRWVFHRAAERRRQQHSARSRYGAQVRHQEEATA